MRVNFYCFSMPRLSNHVKSSIVALRKCNFSWSQICLELGVTRSTAQSVMTKFLKTGTVENKSASGRPRKVTRTGERNLVRIAMKHRRLSAKIIVSQWNSTLSSKNQLCLSTARSILKKNGFHGRAAARKLNINKSVRNSRGQWCRERKHRPVSE